LGIRKKDTSRFKKPHAMQRWKWRKKKMRRLKRRRKALRR